ncbi:MAG TPA: hypothetical protein VEB40_16590 [Flavipsychrobacter sp.]|nr:hypothetical protein [Flavipsychrobacter sp.]
MDNTLGRYEPDNELFRTLVVMVLCFIFSLYYTVFKLTGSDHFEWYDWLVIASVTGGMFVLYRRVHRKLK